MNNINQITFIYDVVNDICHIQANGQPIYELTAKGNTEYQGIVNGTWFQVDELTNHWISFRWNRFNINQREVFYKAIKNEQITYYRKVFYGVERILFFSFSEKDEWVKVESKWRSRF